MRPRSQRYVRCLLCDRPVTLNNLTTHVRKHHPASAHIPRGELYDELDEAPAHAVEPVRVAVDRPERAPVDLPPLGPADLDDIVLTVVGQAAAPTGAIPVELLPAVFAWREATATFLRALERPLERP